MLFQTTVAVIVKWTFSFIKLCKTYNRNMTGQTLLVLSVLASSSSKRKLVELCWVSLVMTFILTTWDTCQWCSILLYCVSVYYWCFYSCGVTLMVFRGCHIQGHQWRPRCKMHNPPLELILGVSVCLSVSCVFVSFLWWTGVLFSFSPIDCPLLDPEQNYEGMNTEKNNNKIQ